MQDGGAGRAVVDDHRDAGGIAALGGLDRARTDLDQPHRAAILAAFDQWCA
jgi:hypothetical protein